MPKINCPYHADNTASMELYPDGKAHCFGCGITKTIADLPGNYTGPANAQPKTVENLKDSIAYIKSLPKMQIRGLELPCDGDSYYILWPDESYYNRRFFEGSVKYKCPSGHGKRLFSANVVSDYNRLAVVEGELNALSVAKALPSWNVMSPGGAGDFHSKQGEAHYPVYAQYKEIALILDQDRAGAIGAIECKSRLQKLNAHVQIVLMEVDANDWLTKEGAGPLATELQTRTGWVGVPPGLPHFWHPM